MQSSGLELSAGLCQGAAPIQISEAGCRTIECFEGECSCTDGSGYFKTALFALVFLTSALPVAQVKAIRAGRLVDPETGTITPKQIILVEAGKFKEIGPNVAIPPGAEVIDLSNQTVLPGLVDAHNHLALTYKKDPENNNYYSAARLSRAMRLT
jgi:hypothetical protein